MNDSVTVYGQHLNETHDAVLFKPLAGPPVWLPKSQIEEEDKQDPPKEGYVVIPEWLAEDREI